MKIVTRTTAINNLKKHIRKDLRKLALQYGITTYETGKQNKGWKGLVLERLAGLQTNISKAPNGLSYELKSVSFYRVQGEFIPKETMAITMVNPHELKEQPFFKSHCCTYKIRFIKIIQKTSFFSIIIEKRFSSFNIFIIIN